MLIALTPARLSPRRLWSPRRERRVASTGRLPDNCVQSPLEAAGPALGYLLHSLPVQQSPWAEMANVTHASAKLPRISCIDALTEELTCASPPVRSRSSRCRPESLSQMSFYG